MRRKSKYFCGILFVGFIFASTRQSAAWGERGHHTICFEATRLVKEPGLRNFLKTRGDLMGHVCNVPDIHWRSLPISVSGSGNAAHFFEPDVYAIDNAAVPVKLADFLTMLGQAGHPPDLQKTGSLWWRAEQFYRSASDAAQRAVASPAPANSLQEQSNLLPYNQAVYDMQTNMGLLGHFVGDASQPYHNTVDFDGYATGHGGIHAYYETICPAEFESNLGVEVHRVAQRLEEIEPGTEVAQVLKNLSVAAYREIGLVEKLDRVLKPSTQITNEQGMSTRHEAERPAPEQQCPRFRPLIVLELAKSAHALAFLWDEIYARGGRPNLQGYQSYRYPLTPDFAPLSY